MTAMEIASLVASVASVVLAIVAIWLSVVFYRMSSQVSESTREAAKGIASSVDRLEKLFDKLYSDTFSMMRDTVTDMRKHIWPEDRHAEEKVSEETERKADQKILALKGEVQEQLADVLKRQEITDGRLSAVTGELSHLVERVISQSRKVESEAREETIREHLLRTIRSLGRQKPTVTADDVVTRLSDMFPTSRLVDEMERMRHDELISYEGESLAPRTTIRLNR